MGGIQGWHIVILVVLALLLFAAPKLPAMARNLGQSMRIFSSEVKQMRNEGKDGTAEPGSETVEGRVVNGERQSEGSHRADER